MPGLDFYKAPESNGAAVVPETPVEESNHVAATPSPEVLQKAGVYYNSRLDPKNFLEGPLSWDPATRLRQMLARPGIVVRRNVSVVINFDLIAVGRLLLVFATVSVPGAHLRQALIACTKVELLPRLHGLVNLTLLSRL